MANDSKDLIMYVLEALHKELNEPNQEYIKKLQADLNNQNNFQVPQQSNESEEHKKFSEDYYNKNKSIIQELFYGE
jgi:ubiquitin C-terminal hydrolase